MFSSMSFGILVFCLLLSEILPFIKNSPNGILHTLLTFYQQHSVLINQILDQSENVLNAQGQSGVAEAIHVVQEALEKQNS